MKRLVLAAVALACFNVAAFAAGPNTFQCVRPDGTVVCTVDVPSGDPSVACNHDCADCNMTCAAKQVIVREGRQTYVNPGAPAPVAPKRSVPAVTETPQYCQEQFQQCVARCRSNPANKTMYDVDACISSCESTRSGCGMKP